MLAGTTTHPFEIKVTRASGCFLFDDKGKAYLDFVSGIGVSNLGHNLERVNKAVQSQMNLHSHVMVYGEYEQKIVNEFARNLLLFFPDSLNTVYPLNSGTEANEAALKIAKRFTGRTEIISFKGAYHGNTAGSMSISSNELKKSAFRPLIPGTKFIELNNNEELNKVTKCTAAVFLETVQGDAGVRIPNQEYLLALRKKCTEEGVLLILDEVQCGYGRTGTFNAFDKYKITPDLVTLGKALGCGLPIGAVVGNNKVLDCIKQHPELGHITTFGGNPVVCAAANEGLKIYKETINEEETEQKGARIENHLKKLSKIKAIRRSGLMIGIELESKELVNECILKAKEKGLILFWFLSTPNSFRISPPLIISNQEIDEACEILESILK